MRGQRSKRFDRMLTDAGVKLHRAVSAATVFPAEEALAQYSLAGSYLRLARGLEALERRQRALPAVTFNCLTCIRDDHERNHALIAAGEPLCLAPAVDLVPRPFATRRRDLAMPCGDLRCAACARESPGALRALPAVPQACTADHRRGARAGEPALEGSMSRARRQQCGSGEDRRMLRSGALRAAASADTQKLMCGDPGGGADCRHFARLAAAIMSLRR